MTTPDKTKSPLSVTISSLMISRKRMALEKRQEQSYYFQTVSLDFLSQRWEFYSRNTTGCFSLKKLCWLLLTRVLALQHPVGRHFTGSQICEEILFDFDFSTNLKPFCSCFGSKKSKPSLSPTYFSHILILKRLFLNHSLKTDIPSL